MDNSLLYLVGIIGDVLSSDIARFSEIYCRTVLLCRTLHLPCFCGVLHITCICGTQGDGLGASVHAELLAQQEEVARRKSEQAFGWLVEGGAVLDFLGLR